MTTNLQLGSDCFLHLPQMPTQTEFLPQVVSKTTNKNRGGGGEQGLGGGVMQ